MRQVPGCVSLSMSAGRPNVPFTTCMYIIVSLYYVFYGGLDSPPCLAIGIADSSAEPAGRVTV